MKTPALTKLYYTLILIGMFCILDSQAAYATQMHSNSEGIIVHQLGHMFFLVSMAILIFTINGKELNREKGWKLLQYSAFLFILWNLDAALAHFLDNQINAVTVTMTDNWQTTITARNSSRFLAVAYYILKLDHLLCVPAIVLFYKGLCQILETQTMTGNFGKRR
ncbi:MAG: hypothetical protein V1793_15025 [Pseudomonadota bacterium]